MILPPLLISKTGMAEILVGLAADEFAFLLVERY
jgi:hypothetical protein